MSGWHPIGGGTTAAAGGGSPTIAIQEDGVSIVASPDTLNFKDFNIEDAGGNDAAIYHNLPGLAGGRLTLTTALPVTTADVTAATTMYYTPYLHDKISLFDGTRWKIYTFSEISLSIPATTNTMYDRFIYDNAGTLTLEDTAWTNDSTRATALVRQNGAWVKSGATTRLYLGSYRTTGTSGQTEDSRLRRFVWNNNNRIARYLLGRDGTNSWTYNTAAFRASNNNTTDGVGRIAYIVGLSEHPIDALAISLATSDTAGTFVSGIGIDSSTINSALTFGHASNTVNALQIQARYRGFPGIGYHYVQHLEYGVGAGTQTWYGDAGGSTFQSGLWAEIWG